MATVGFLHTATAHVATFRDLLAQRDPELADRHLVDAGLLATARLDGPEVLAAVVADRVRRLVAEGADVVLCTCSTTGPVAEAVGARAGVRVVRVERPMVQAAVLAGRRVAVVSSRDDAALALRRLLAEEAAASDRRVDVLDVRCAADTFALFREGDLAAYAAAVAQEVRPALLAADPPVDVVVLAQASMVHVAPLLRDLHVPVLTSPRLAVEAVVELVVPVV